MIKLLLIFILIFSACSSDIKKKIIKNEKKQQKEQIIKKNNEQKLQILTKNFNTNIEIKLENIPDKKLFTELHNNYGRQEFTFISDNYLKNKLKKIKNFSNFEPNIVFDKEGLIFFEKKGNLIKFDFSNKIIWKKNYYSKQEQKSNPHINFAIDGKNLILSDSLSKYYRINPENGDILWSKINSSKFNSQIKIDKDRFYAVDSENTLHCFSLKNGNKIWSYKTENFFIKSNRKLSIVIDNDKVIFNNSVGDITAVDANKGTLVWQTPTQNNQIYAETISLRTSTLVLDNDSIYFSNNKNEFYSLNKNDGFINWKQTINSDLRPIITSNIIFTVSSEGFLFFIDSKNGNILKSQDLLLNYKDKTRKILNPIGMSLGIDKIFITLNNGRLIIIESKNGKLLKTIKIDNNYISEPIIYNNRLYIVKDNSILIFD